MSGAGSVEAVLGAVAFATERFLRDEVWHGRIDEVLAHLGAAAGVDRAYLFQNVRGPDGRRLTELRYEWEAPDIPRILEGEAPKRYAYAPEFARWLEVLGRGEVVHGAVDELPEPERARLVAGGVVSLIVVPVFVQEEWWGYIGFDDCHAGRRWSSVEVDALRTAAGALAAAIAREQVEERRRFSEGKFRSLVEEGPAVLYIDNVDETASSLYIGPQIEAMLGYSVQEWLDDADLWPKLLHPDDRPRALAENTRHNETGEPFALEYRMIAKDGSVVWVHDEATMVRDELGQPRYSQGVIIDISARKEVEEDAAFLAYHDPLTGLPSRSMFEELLQLSVARARRHEGSVAVVCLDLDKFRIANDSLGYDDGDALLRMVADRLREATRETDLVARRGGDEFLLLLSDLEREHDPDAVMLRAETAVQRIRDAMSAPFLVAGTELFLSVSMGMSLFPQDAADTPGLLRNADAAMYESKRNGPGGYVVSAHGTFDSSGKLELITRLRKAIQNQRWVLHYQPIVRLATGAMEGVEALIRWVEPDGSVVPPAEFIPLAEELGLIEEIGDWVIREIVHQSHVWRELGIDLEISFNLSPRQFWQNDLPRRILDPIREGGLPADRFLVEITESSAMMDPRRARDILLELDRGGLRIAIDDFGTGYSSLSRLREMPVEVLKIDRSFVAGVDVDAPNASIVSAFIQLAGGLGMTTLAEGIETEAELAFLTERGCRLGQGFLFSRPVLPEEIISFALGGVRLHARSG
jgi:diguanylate cyclase (GGDEF)-like protein/PAS domain S-box-containing protein